MSPRSWARTVSVGLASLVLTVLAPVAAQGAPTDLIDSTPATVVLSVPAPGETREWEMSVRNLTDGDLPLSLQVLGDGGQVLFTGPTPLELTVRDASGVLIDAAPVGGLLDSAVELPRLPAGATYSLSGSVELPAEADNRYQGVSGSLTLRFVTSVDTPSEAPHQGPGHLAFTGANVGVALIVLAAALILAGIILTVRSRAKGTES
ncbi:hypothetical protein [Propionicicella superfundia]|uniref:hypothetical protein n=1 Tax=Propionicicella superfundia TaxID=348582 RepID=UPI0004214586|nr:hypothetical protein [Propionicicella superfundia]